MSRPFRDKNKDLVKLEVVTADVVWTKDKNGKPILRKDIEIYGRVDKGTSAFVTSTNLHGKNHRVIEDTSKLSKKTKNDIVRLLKNDNRKVVYLIRTDNSSNKK
ncbi:MAG: hypothetical protein OSJ68_06910 [Clostridia bacterium]|nr:hypothetical protein [Clostridia bacterium]